MPKIHVRKLLPSEHQLFSGLAITTKNVFASDLFLNLDPNIDRIGIFSGNQLIGGFCTSQKKVFGVKIIVHPKSAPNCALFINYKFDSQSERNELEKQISAGIASYVKSIRNRIVLINFPVEFRDAQPFIWSGLKIGLGYTYRICLRNFSMDELISAGQFSLEKRRSLAKSQRDGVIVETSQNSVAVLELISSSMLRDGYFSKMTAIKKYVVTLIDKPKISTAYLAFLNGSPIASGFMIHEKTISYYVLGGTDRSHNGAVVALLHKAIIESKKKGMEYFDFEGSMNIRIEKFFRGFGGELTPYFILKKINPVIDFFLNWMQARSMSS